MSRKNVLNVYVTPTAAVPTPVSPSTSITIPLSSAFTTLYTSMNTLDNVSYQIVITTTNSTGTFTLQGSNDKVNFDTIGTAALVNGTNDTATVWVNQAFCSHYVRLAYTPTVAGTGTCTISLTAKQIGG